MSNTSVSAPIAPTTKDVRAFYVANPTRLSTLSGDAILTVTGRDGKAPRGRLHPDVRADYNTDHKGKFAYAEGTERTQVIEYRRTQPSGRKVKAEARMTDKALREAAVALGLAGPDSRGPLSKAALAGISEALTEGKVTV